MKLRLLAALLAFGLPLLGHADTVADLVRAQKIITQVQQTLAKLEKVRSATNAAAGANASPASPTPLTDNSGKFFLPYSADGQLVGWAAKAINAQVGAAIGGKVGGKAGEMAAAQVPIPFAGGLIAKGAKKKGKQLGALAAVGGADYVKSSSSLSFSTLEEMSLYMHLNCSSNSDYIKGFAAAMAIYPDLAKTYEQTVKKAYAGR